MAGTRVDTVRRIYDAILRGDVEPWVAGAADDFEWRWPPGMIEGATVFRGREGVREGLRLFSEAWDELTMEPQELIERGDEVLAIVRYRARGLTSGVEFDESMAHIWRFRGGRLVELRMFGRPERARQRFLEDEDGS
jgi:ketosteroid isomerase-like protein